METLFSPVALILAQVLGLEWDYTLRNVVLGSATLGVVGGVLGCFATLRRQSLLGDTLAHAALPGVCIAFMITGTRESLPLMIGAGLSGLVGTLIFLGIIRGSRIKEDAALGIVLSVGFGLGILLLTRIQHSGQSGQSGLDRFLFGQAASLVESDVVTMAILGGGALLVVAVLFKEFKLISFDLDFAASIGYPTTVITIILTALIIVAVVIGLQAVGVILVVAILIAPAAAARQWTDKLSTMLTLAGIFGAVSGVAGAILSSQISRLPTGPTVVLVATTITLVSLLFAPRRGVIWGAIRRRQHRRQVQLTAVLRDLAEATRLGEGPAVPVGELESRQGTSPQTLSRQLATLSSRGLVARSTNGAAGWSLTMAGIEAARAAERRERIWKLSMARQMDLSVDAVHLDGTELERVLPPDVLVEIETQMLAEDTDAVNRSAVASDGHGPVAAQTRTERPQ